MQSCSKSIRATMKHAFSAFALGLLVACASGGGQMQGGAGTFDAVKVTRPATAPVASGVDHSAEYRIGSQDTLDITVFQVAELTSSARVNTGGDISLPLVGTLHVGGLNVQQVEQLIAEKLSQTYLQSPQVTVFVKEYASQRVTLEGAIIKPGVYPLTGETTLLQMVAIGGGLQQMADPANVLVFRMIDGQKMAARFDLRMIRQGNAVNPNIYGDDIVVFPESGSKSAFSRFMQALPMVGLFRTFGL